MWKSPGKIPGRYHRDSSVDIPRRPADGVGGAGPDPFGIVGATQKATDTAGAGLEVALGVALLGVAVVIVAGQTQAGGEVARAAGRAGKLAITRGRG